jgi:hypothetical protein
VDTLGLLLIVIVTAASLSDPTLTATSTFEPVSQNRSY